MTEKGQKRKNIYLDTETKHNILKKIKSGEDKNDILRQYKICERTYHYLLTDEKKILNRVQDEGNKKRKIFKEVKNKTLDAAVLEWFRQARDKGNPVSGPLIQEKALILNEKLNGSPKFKASNGWLEKFKKRYNIRCVDMRGEKLSNDSESAEDFSRYLEEKIASENLILDNIYIMPMSREYIGEPSYRVLFLRK